MNHNEKALFSGDHLLPSEESCVRTLLLRAAREGGNEEWYKVKRSKDSWINAIVLDLEGCS